ELVERPVEARDCKFNSFQNSKGTDSLMSNVNSISQPGHRSFLQRLRDAADAVRNTTDEDPWEPTLRKLKGRVGHDRVERCSTADVFDHVEVPMRRRPSLTVRLSRVMRKLGWSSIRARGLNPGSYRDRVRGYARGPGDWAKSDQIGKAKNRSEAQMTNS